MNNATTHHFRNPGTQRRSQFRRWFAGILVCLGGVMIGPQLFAQGRIFQPLDQNVPPGVAGYWAGALGRATPLYLQPVRVHLPSKGTVTFYDVTTRKLHSKTAPAMSRMGVGFTFRFKIADMPEFPGVTLFPSVELIDRLHPPRGKADDFPIPLQLTEEEIRLATDGRMVTKVVYLEQPQLAVPSAELLPTVSITPENNLITEADRRGRPMAIIRIGSRQPSETDLWTFLGRGGPIQVPTTARQ